jgi:prepilin-type N-terminal cleavage/methylation domain-containing protein
MQNNRYLNRTNTGNAERGFTLLEIMVSMVIFLVVTGAIWGLMRTAMLSRGVVNQQTTMSRNARLGLSVIGKDTYNAGFGYPLKNTVVLPDNRIATLIGIPLDPDLSRDTVPPIMAGNNITTNTYNTVLGVKTDQVTLLFKDSSFNIVGTIGPPDTRVSQPLNVNAASTTGGGIDEIVPISGSNSVCRINDIYLITGNTGSTLGVSTAMNGTSAVQFSNGDVLGFNQTGLIGPLRSITVPATMQRVKMITYFVTPEGILTRREFANVPPAVPAVAFADEPLVYGVEDFQIQYIMDNGSLVDNPSAGPDGIAGTPDDTQSNLAAVRQIRYTISVRSQELNSAGQPYRETMTSTFSTRNLGYDAN